MACAYTATVATDVITSSIDLKQEPLSQELRAALGEPPGWVPWPPAQLPTGVALSVLSDMQLLLFRLKALFDFGAGVNGDTSTSLSEAIDAEWPALGVARTSVATGQATITYAQAAVSADLDAKGETGWGFQPNLNGGAALPIPDITPASGRPEYDRVLQNLVRLDLLRRIEATL
jgi:hypothetical protein